jgi:hypothetical protein
MRVALALTWALFAGLLLFGPGCNCGKSKASNSSSGAAGTNASGTNASTGNTNGTTGVTGSTGTNGTNGTNDGGSRQDYCNGQGAPILLNPLDGGSVCTGDLAQVEFRYALCTCEGYVNSHDLTTDAFDSDAGPYSAANAHSGGGVGTDGNFSASGLTHVGGTLWVSDPSGITSSQEVDAHDELHCGGPVSASGQTLSVGADAWIAGNQVLVNTLDVTGTLTVPSSTQINATTQNVGQTVRAPVTVPQPCDCNAADIVDISAFVEAYRTANDNANANVDEHAFENPTGPVNLTLPCGRFFFTRVGGSQPITINLQGRTAIFIGGDLAAGGFTVNLGSGELDLFVEGNVVSSGEFDLGSSNAPSRARIYVGGNGTIDLSANTVFGGNIYAPNSELVLAGDATIYGSAFVRRLSTSGDVTIHYDVSVLNAGSECLHEGSNGIGSSSGTSGTTGTSGTSGTTGGGACTTCQDCENQACIGGTCGACTDSSQCCSPLVCQNGSCQILFR